MNLFNGMIQDVRDFCTRHNNAGDFKVFQAAPHNWPTSGSNDIVFKTDTGLELGSPKDASISFLLWTGDPSLVRNRRISLKGPDITEATSERLSFGKVVLIAGNDFNEDNCYERFHEMDLLRYDIALQGYMMRAVSQYMREWSRISKEAVAQGLSFEILGSALIDQLTALPYVDAAEVLFVTSSADHVRELKQTGDQFIQYINAMTKMTTDHDFDCDTCEFQPVCDEAEVLRDMHKAMVEKA